MKKGWLGLLSIGVVGTSAAAPTGLIVIPIADILRHREFSVNHALTGTERSIDKRYYHIGGATIGIADRAEVGVSTEYLGRHSWDAKVLVAEGQYKGLGYAASVGAANGLGKSVDPYAVGRVDFNKFRIHGGAWRLNNVVQGMIGADLELTDKWVLLADHIGGREGATWVALSWDAGGGLSVMGAFGRPNTRSDGYQHQLVLTYTVRL